MREIIDGLFGVPVSEALFGGMNVYALANGLPCGVTWMLAVMDEVDSTPCQRAKGHKPQDCQVYGQISEIPEEVTGGARHGLWITKKCNGWRRIFPFAMITG